MLLVGCLLCTASISGLQAQEQNTIHVSGQVVDEEGKPLIAVAVVAKSTPIGTYTDIEGNFSLNVPSDTEKLIFSCIGYLTEEINVPSEPIYLIMRDDTPVYTDHPVRPWRPIRGEVLDPQAEPIAGVKVRWKSTETSTSTRADGSFFLPGTGLYTLEVSCTGYTTTEIDVRPYYETCQGEALSGSPEEPEPFIRITLLPTGGYSGQKKEKTNVHAKE